MLQLLGLTYDKNSSTINLFQRFEETVAETFDLPEANAIRSAMQVMSQAHIEQKRKDGGLYIEHPIDVALRVIEILEHPNADAVIAAIFHDTIEDQSKKFLELSDIEIDPDVPNEVQALQTLRERYGEEVGRLVSGLSNPDFREELAQQGITPDKPEYSKRKRELYAEHVAKIIQDPTLCIIKYSDFSQNGLDLSGLPNGEEKKDLCRKYRPVIDLFRSRISDETSPLDTNKQPSMLLELDESAEYIDEYLAA